MKAERQIEGLLERLNDEQREAVTYSGGPLMVLAGAGTGKTRVVTYRAAYLVAQGANPQGIMALTFTNKAAREMQRRLERLLGEYRTCKWVGTFHSVCLRLLRWFWQKTGLRQDFVVIDEEDRDRLLMEVVARVAGRKETVANYSRYIEHLKNTGAVFSQPGDVHSGLETRVFQEYQRRLREANAVDFGDLLCLAVKLLREDEDVRMFLQKRFAHLLVDEFQDTNLVQYELLKLLVPSSRDICVVGDDDQSIYSWRGARVDNVLDFPKDFPDATIIRLRLNYRSTRQVLAAAQHLIAHNRRRHPKDLDPVLGDGPSVKLWRATSEEEEARRVCAKVAGLARAGHDPAGIAIFFRTHAQSRPFEEWLRKHGVPYTVVGGLKFYQRKEIKDVLAYLRLAMNPMDELSLLRAIKTPPRGLGQATIERARELARRAHKPLLVGFTLFAENGSRQARLALRFVDFITTLAEFARENDALRVLDKALEDSGYSRFLEKDRTISGQTRRENVEALRNAVADFVHHNEDKSVRAFVDHVSLFQAQDESAKEKSVSLMTVHAAKGLEFDSVFVCGLAEGLFPHVLSMGSERELEEERRLMYVAMTRARRALYLSYPSLRYVRGRPHIALPSRFITEISRRHIRLE